MQDAQFDSCTPRFNLPLLFAGQAQKEVFVNEIAARMDAMLHLAVEEEAVSPPADAIDGQSWLIGPDPDGAWTGKAGHIASFQGGNWVFAKPCPGMRLFNKAADQEMSFRRSWEVAAKPVLPSGGTTIDNESRAAISALIDALVAARILPRD